MLKSELFIIAPKDLLIDTNSSINTDIMNFLSIDCSTYIGSLFLKIKNKSFNKILQSDKSNNDLLMKQILDFFKENNLKLDDISHIFVNQGPGNFSGLRGSLAIAKGISISKSLNLFGYNTFLLSSVKFFDKEDFIYSLIEFRKRYFIRKFNRYLNSVSKIEEVTIKEILKNYVNKFKIIPKNMVKYFDKEILKLQNLNIVDLDYNELKFLQLKGLLNDKLVKPLYLN